MIAYLLPVMATRLYHIASLKILEATSSPCGISPCNIIQYSRLSVYFLVGIGITISDMILLKNTKIVQKNK
jgi:hypothetical protein